MFLKSLATAAALVGAAHALLTEVTIFDPPANYTIPRTLYARTLLLNQFDPQTGNNVLLATWENYLPDDDPFPYYPIFQSFDLGETWSERSRVYDQVNGWGLRYQPFLYELEEDLGDYPAGTVLIAGNSIPQNLSHTQIDLYASRDKGYTWEFVSRIASGGEAVSFFSFFFLVLSFDVFFFSRGIYPVLWFPFADDIFGFRYRTMG